MDGEEKNTHINTIQDAESREKIRSRWFFGIFFALIFLSISATFYRVFIARDYLVTVETICSPEAQSCFARDVCDTEDQVCSEGDTPTETSYYKIVERKAFAFPETCASGSADSPLCADLSCRPGEADCTETFCSDETVPEGERCMGPGFVPEDIMTPDDSAASSYDTEENSTDQPSMEKPLEENEDGNTVPMN